MPNDKPGDHPLSDVLTHDLPTYGPEIDGLIREIDALEGPNGTALATARYRRFSSRPRQTQHS